MSIVFGSIHPYEGIRPLKDDEEIFPIYAALSALASFIEQHEDDLAGESIKLVQAEYVVPSPDKNDSSCQVSVSTVPDLTCELEGFVERIQEEVDSKIVQAYSAPEEGGGEEDLSSARGKVCHPPARGRVKSLSMTCFPMILLSFWILSPVYFFPVSTMCHIRRLVIVVHCLRKPLPDFTTKLLPLLSL